MTSGIIFGNRLLDVAAISCFLAQFYKVFSPLLKGEKIQWRRLFQTGGMPSSHASTVVSLSTGVYMLKGPSSIEFAISMVFMGIILYDAWNQSVLIEFKLFDELFLFFCHFLPFFTRRTGSPRCAR